jgi:hypothetical protein
MLSPLPASSVPAAPVAGRQGSALGWRCSNHANPTARRWLKTKQAAQEAAGRSLEWPHMHLLA